MNRGGRRGALLLALALPTAGPCSCAGARPSARGAAPASSAARALVEARSLRRAGDLEAALDRYAEARAARPDDVAAHLGYVSLLLELGRGSQARAEYATRAAAPQALPVDVVMTGRLASDQSSSALRRVYEAAAEREPGTPWWPLALVEVELSEAEAWSRRRESARERGDRAAETLAHDQARGALARAERDVARAAALAPAAPEVELYRGHLRALEGDLLGGGPARQAAYRAAASAFERATQADPGSVEAWAGLADVSARLDEQGESLLAWIEVARRTPSDPYARREVARRLHAIGRRREAVEEYRVVAQLTPHDADPWLRAGDAHAEDERWEAAAAAYREALHRDPAAVEAHARLGGVLEQQGRRAEAREAWQRYLDQGGERRDEAERKLEQLLTGTR